MKLNILLSILLPLVASRALPSPEGPRATTVTSRQSTSTNELLALILSLFPINVAIQNIGSLITDAEKGFAAALGYETTRNDLESGTCGDLLILFARGTTEPGNVGALVGPPFFDAVQGKLPSGKTLAVQGVVDYAASIEGFLQGGEAQGSQRMATLASQAVTRCPKSHLVLVGYSQGGQLVHNAAKLMSASAVAAVSSIVIFGDPDNGSAIQGVDASKVLTVCHSGDNICEHGDLVLLPHLTYLQDAGTAADFVLKRSNL